MPYPQKLTDSVLANALLDELFESGAVSRNKLARRIGVCHYAINKRIYKRQSQLREEESKLIP